MLKQFGVFVSVGLTSAVIDVVVTSALLRVNMHHALAASVGFAMGLLINFMGHSRLSFQAEHSAGMALRFALVLALNLGLTLLLVEAAAVWLDNPMAGKLIALPVVAIHGFFWGKYWVFK